MNIKKIKIFFIDVDGVLTDGTLLYIEDKFYRSFNIKDGIGFHLLKLGSIEPVVISAKFSKETEKRCEELNVEFYSTEENKLETIQQILEKKGYSWEETGYIGDDIPDIPVMKKVSFSATPSDAPEEVKKIADFVCKNKGGDGAFREVVEFILKEQEKWDVVLRKFLCME